MPNLPAAPPSPGRLVVITGPSGVGKGTLIRRLLKTCPEFRLSVSATTRAARPGEVEGTDYFFMDRPRFEALIEQGQLLEWAEFAGNFYGTPRAPVEAQLHSGQSVILEIELQGARQVRRCFPVALSVFILPPSLEVLRQRLEGRGQDSPAAVAARLQAAVQEIAAAPEFDRQITNDDLEVSLSHLVAILRDQS